MDMDQEDAVHYFGILSVVAAGIALIGSFTVFGCFAVLAAFGAILAGFIGCSVVLSTRLWGVADLYDFRQGLRLCFIGIGVGLLSCCSGIVSVTWYQAREKKTEQKNQQTIAEELKILGVDPKSAQEPLPVEPSGISVTKDTPLDKGMRLQAQLWNGQWYIAEVLDVLPNGRVKVHYLGHHPKWDMDVKRKALQLLPNEGRGEGEP